MDNRGSQLVKIFYPIQTLLKALFIFMSLANFPFTLAVAFASSLIGVLRVCKTPQMNKQYLGKVFMNNHGQNLLYITFGAVGHVNYLYYSPIVLFFGYGIVEYVKIKYPVNRFNGYIDLIRNNRFYIFQGKGKLQIILFVYLLFTLPFDFMGRIVKLFLIGQLLLIKYKINQEFRYSCNSVNNWILQKTRSITIIYNAYLKLSEIIYNFASKDMQPNQQ